MPTAKTLRSETGVSNLRETMKSTQIGMDRCIANPAEIKLPQWLAERLLSGKFLGLQRFHSLLHSLRQLPLPWLSGRATGCIGEVVRILCTRLGRECW